MHLLNRIEGGEGFSLLPPTFCHQKNPMEHVLQQACQGGHAWSPLGPGHAPLVLPDGSLIP